MVICSLVSPSYDPHWAIWRLIHDMVMIAEINRSVHKITLFSFTKPY